MKQKEKNNELIKVIMVVKATNINTETVILLLFHQQTILFRSSLEWKFYISQTKVVSRKFKTNPSLSHAFNLIVDSYCYCMSIKIWVIL